MAAPLVFDLSFLPPGRMTAPRIIGGALDSGVALSGVSVVSDITDGGFVAIDYLDIQLSNTNRDRILYFNRLMNALSGGVRYCIVPFLTDYIAPYSEGAMFDGSFNNDFAKWQGGAVPTQGRVPFSDDAPFVDGSLFSQPPISGAIAANAVAGQATVTLNLINGRKLQGGEWFGVKHATKSFRAYCITDVDSQSVDNNGAVTATVGIRPTLRDAVSYGMAVDWWRPRCMMRVKSGADPTLDLSQFWYSTPSISFVEAIF